MFYIIITYFKVSLNLKKNPYLIYIPELTNQHITFCKTFASSYVTLAVLKTKNTESYFY